MDARLDVQDSVCDGRHTLILAGELDIATAGDLEEMICHVCSKGTTAVALDLSKLTFMDSSGLYVVLRAAELCKQQALEFSVSPGSGQARGVFELCGLLGEAAPFVLAETP